MVSDSDIAKTEEFFKKAFPDIASKNIHTQLGVHFEEIREMVDVLQKGAKDQKTLFLLNMLSQALKAGEIHFKTGDNLIDIRADMREEILDGIGDQLVTATGFGYMLSMNVSGAFGEINQSNFSKFGVNGEPIYDANRKMIKGPNYFKPNLKPFV